MNHRKWLFFFILVCFAQLAGVREQLSFAGTNSFLTIQGKSFVDSTGKAILLRGMGLGGWLVPEGYQVHIPGFGSPSDIRAKIVALVGETNADLFYQRYTANYVAESDIAKLAEWGFNSIRLPFNYRLLSPEDQPGVFLEEGFQLLDQVVAWCKKYGLYLILDMHCAPGGQNAGNISDSDGIEARLWTEPQNQDRTVAIWEKIAERYANEPIIAGYDLLNEPVLPSGYSNTVLRAFYMRLSQAIRKLDPNHILFIEGNWYATDFRDLTPPWDAKMVYSFHKYWNENSLAAIQSYLTISTNYNLPLWLGETGENSNPWFAACVDLIEQRNISWCWWTHKKVATTTSPYSAPIGPVYQKVLDYWNGRAAKPSVEVALAGLLEMAENLKLENCEYRPGVIPALFKGDFRTRPAPVKDHVLPGKIFAVDYDVGNQGIAYYDTDYENTKGLGNAQWNKGWEYRNDGVDIERSQDPQANGFNVGWIESGEWLLFTVNVTVGGRYRVTFRTATPNAGGKIQLYLDEQLITESVSVPATGGWQSWSSFAVDSVQLPLGVHQLKLVFQTGGFNLSYLEFTLIDTSVEQKGAFMPVTPAVYLAQNFPNPFNRSTTIPVLALEAARARLAVYDARGTLVKELFTGQLEPGTNSIQWNGTDKTARSVSSGVYFLKIFSEGSTRTKPMVLLK